MKYTEYDGGIIKAKAIRGYQISIVIKFTILILILLGIVLLSGKSQRQVFISPCPTGGCYVSPTPTPEITPTNTPTPSKAAFWTGKASYYSRAGCLGCSPSLTMANGETLDDAALTVAFNRVPLNSYVTIKNVVTGASVIAKVTDRGGFERHGKIVDLSVATHDAIGCGSVCNVEIEI